MISPIKNGEAFNFSVFMMAWQLHFEHDVKYSAKVHHKLRSIFESVRIITCFNNIAVMNEPIK